MTDDTTIDDRGFPRLDPYEHFDTEAVHYHSPNDLDVYLGDVWAYSPSTRTTPRHFLVVGFTIYSKGSMYPPPPGAGVRRVLCVDINTQGKELYSFDGFSENYKLLCRAVNV